MLIWILFFSAITQQAALLDIYLRGQKAYGDIAAAASEHSCIAEVSKDMVPLCKIILFQSDHEAEGEIIQRILALRLTNCYLEMAGMLPINCSVTGWKGTILGSFGVPKTKSVGRGMAECLKRIGEQNSGAAFQVFVQQLGRIFDICMYLDAKDFQRQSAEAAETLLKSSKDASALITSVLGTVQDSYEILEAYTRLLDTLSKNIAHIETTAREDQNQILSSLTAIRLGMQDSEKELNNLMLHTASLQEQVLHKVDYSVTTLYSRLDTINDQLEVLGEGARQLTSNVSAISQRLETVSNDTDTLSEKFQHLSEAVDESRKVVEASQEASRDIMVNARLAMESIEQQAKKQAKTLSNINSAVGSISSGLGGDGSSGSSWKRVGPLQLLWKLERAAPGGILWYLALHICAQTLITLGASGKHAVSVKRVALLVVLLSYGVELLINTTLNKILTTIWIYGCAPFIALFGRIAEWFRIRRIRRFLFLSCEDNETCLRSYESQVRITPGMGYKEIFYGYMYGLWESDYVDVLSATPLHNKFGCSSETHDCFLQYAHDVTKFSISSGTVSTIVRLVSSAGLALYVVTAILNIPHLHFPFENIYTSFVQKRGTIGGLDGELQRQNSRINEETLRLSTLESQRRTELGAFDHSIATTRKGSTRAARREYTLAHKKRSRASSVSL
ncbi:Hypothetical protein GLP15_1342 [Giardia lamblia P15]|uniref:Uncharacterized protein n=1 Tax=Giardia intestinalis (strain P15) TaxID=658858 RepID=E1F863_GIAIA|nr:Hypothetical protein GLP15_1342 [Giardia lamblia P15]